MFQDSPIFAVIYFAGALWLLNMWVADLRAFEKSGKPRAGALEGAAGAPMKLVFAGVAAALALLAAHAQMEAALGLDDEQSKVRVWAVFSWLAAAVIEELIFRGYLAVRGRGKFLLWVSVVLFSLIFALAHPFMWDYAVPDGGSVFGGAWKFDFSAKALFATVAVFDCSMLFYVLRFLPQNPKASILPCIAAHCAYNLGVFAIKAANGFVVF